MLNEENLVATLEQSLRQTKNAQGRLLGRLREAEAEADNLRNEIVGLLPLNSNPPSRRRL